MMMNSCPLFHVSNVICKVAEYVSAFKTLKAHDVHNHDPSFLSGDTLKTA